jgi:predicted membrane protein
MSVGTHPDTDGPTRRRPGPGTRRVGYVVAVVVNAVMLYAVNRWPGWDAVPFLTEDAATVIGWVNASILVSLFANLVYLARDPRWLKALGDLLTTGVGLVVMVRIWEVFPFDFGDSRLDWALVIRILLVVGIVGSAIGIIVAIASFVKALAGSSISHST